jgi:hypothetical protein
MYNYTTSLPAYKEPKDKCRQIVYDAIKVSGSCTDKQVADYLRWPINRITGRRGELLAQGKIVLDKLDKDPESNRLVSYWKIK